MATPTPEQLRQTPPAPETPPTGERLPPLTPGAQKALESASQGNAQAFETEVNQLTIDDLSHLSTHLLHLQGKQELSLTLGLRDTMRRRFEKLRHEEHARVGEQATREKFDLNVNARLHLRNVLTQTMGHDIGPAIAKPARVAGEAIVSGMSKLEMIPYIGPVIRELKYLFGTSMPEAAKNITKTIVRLAERTFLTWMSQMGSDRMRRSAEDRLLRNVARDAITEVVELEQGVTDKNVVRFRGIDEYAWSRLTIDQKRTTDWKAKAHLFVDAMRRAGQGTNERPIEVTIAGILNADTAQRTAETQQSQARIDAVRTTLHLDQGTIISVDDQFSFQRSGGKVTLLTISRGTTDFNERGEPISQTAKLLTEAMQRLTSAQEVLLLPSQAELKIEKIPGTKISMGSDTSLTILPEIDILATAIQAQDRTRIAHEALSGMQVEVPRIALVTESGTEAVKWNSKTSIQQAASFFQQHRTDLEAARTGKEWKLDGNLWIDS